MAGIRKPQSELSIKEIDRELIARAAQIPEEKLFKFKDREGTPERDAIVRQLKELYDSAASLSPDEALRHVCTQDLIKILKNMTWKETKRGGRGIWYGDARMDFCDIEDEEIKRNANSVAAICTKDSLIDESGGFSILKVKNYGKTFNLCDYEPFHHQPIAAGRMCTGFLVKEDMIATAYHFVRENIVTDLRIVFGFKMEDPYTSVTRVPNENIYSGVEVTDRVYRKIKGSESDWALVKLDRKVEGRSKVKLSRKRIFSDQPVYVIGYPCGLPLKYAPGAQVHDINKTFFGSHLDIYAGNSGSPVFSSDTHEVIGMVMHGDNRDFRWTGKCWISVIYPNRDICSKGAQCTMVSEFIKQCG
jgi:V8-like Glu-specific endopeptidase